MRSIYKIFFLLALITLTCACVPKSTTSGSSSQPAGANAGATGETFTDPNYYYDFDDILIPRELDYSEEESYTLDNAKFRAGIMRFSGRVELSDLLNFFINNMGKDNWEKVTSVKGKISVLSFEKFNKSCIIQVQDGFGKVTVTVIAVETKDGAAPKKGLK